jgi:Mrr N-terminal domain
MQNKTKRGNRLRVEVTFRLSPETVTLADRLVRLLEERANGTRSAPANNEDATRPRRGELDVFRRDYTPFAVVALDNLGGRARRRAIIDEARNVLGERLRPDDLKPVSPGKRLPRWRYRLGWAITQARHQLYVKKIPGERGIRVLTPEGKQFVATVRDRIDRGEL